MTRIRRTIWAQMIGLGLCVTMVGLRIVASFGWKELAGLDHMVFTATSTVAFFLSLYLLYIIITKPDIIELSEQTITLRNTWRPWLVTEFGYQFIEEVESHWEPEKEWPDKLLRFRLRNDVPDGGRNSSAWDHWDATGYYFDVSNSKLTMAEIVDAITERIRTADRKGNN